MALECVDDELLLRGDVGDGFRCRLLARLRVATSCEVLGSGEREGELVCYAASDG